MPDEIKVHRVSNVLVLGTLENLRKLDKPFTLSSWIHGILESHEHLPGDCRLVLTAHITQDL